jgi:ribosomal protein S4
MISPPIYKKSKLLRAKLSPFQKITPKLQKALLQRTRRQNFVARPRAKINLQNDRLIKYFYFLHKQKPNLLNQRLVKYEQRIDVALFRVNFCQSIRAARQLIHQKKVFVNNQIIKSPFYFLKPGDIFKLNTLKFQPKLEKKLSKKSMGFEVNYTILQAIYLYTPAFIAFPFQLNRTE